MYNSSKRKMPKKIAILMEKLKTQMVM